MAQITRPYDPGFKVPLQLLITIIPPMIIIPRQWDLITNKVIFTSKLIEKPETNSPTPLRKE